MLSAGNSSRRLSGLIRVGAVVALAAASTAHAVEDAQVFFSQVYEYDVAKARDDPASIDRKLAAYIDGATRTLDAALFEVHNDRIVEALTAAKKRGVAVRIVSDGMYRTKRPESTHL